MPTAPTNPLIRKLENYTRLSEEDRAAALRLCAERPQMLRPRQDLVSEGEEPRVVRLVTEGWACRYKHLADGRRQVLGLFLAGDLCDLNVFVLREMDHSIGAVTTVHVARITRDVFEEVTLAHPRLLQALWWDNLVASAIQREWIMNLGSRDAFERVTHLMCEVFLRLRAAGQAEGGSCEWPLTQAVVADIAGLSLVHVSRTFHAIRDAGFVEVVDRTLIVHDLPALMAACQFNPSYLHLGHEGRHLDAQDAGPAPRPQPA
jgi:CRP-like cAMP-binding protein